MPVTVLDAKMTMESENQYCLHVMGKILMKNPHNGIWYYSYNRAMLEHHQG